jgi:hypothetical protein
VLGERARVRLAEMVNVDGDSIATAAATFGVGWHCANAAVAEHSDPVIDDDTRLQAVTAIGVDEKQFLNANARHRTIFTTQIVDLDRHLLFDVIEGRSRDVLGSWLQAEAVVPLRTIATWPCSSGSYQRTVSCQRASATLAG